MRHRSTTRRGFTLVEVLVVITIIAVLSGLLLVGVNNAMDKAVVARVVTEESLMKQEIDRYQSEANDYPPTLVGAPGSNFSAGNPIPADAFDRGRFNRHIHQAFSRYRSPLEPYEAFGILAAQLNLDIYDLDQAESLVLWLGGVSDMGGAISTTKLIGFSSDKSFPFSFTTNPQFSVNQPRPSLYEFPSDRLVDRDGDGWQEFAPNQRTDAGPQNPPYVYFDYRCYDVVTDVAGNGISFPYPNPNDASHAALVSSYGLCLPYATSPPPAWQNQVTWVEPKSFQIIATGFDGRYGDATLLRGFPIGPYTAANDGAYEDNLVSFCTRTLRDEMEANQ